MPTLHLKKIKCIEQEDWTFHDDVVIKVNGAVVNFHSMDAGDTDTLDEYVNFTGKALIQIYEADYGDDDDDFLGAHTVRRGSGVLEFTGDDAHYKLSYAVE
ncbi:hypothetical protein TPA0598_03_06600 [Streptomyces lydicamycinicus]|jgi:hypothetical protein|uniref:Uncharacterized protein n=1 Tax=Streptomyces lydicamycinicus TaxID=1546107 RepID=A0A0P4R6Y2_9ACTN|nr:hypothetical protein [Streptomyces lydicamycinicus]GAO08199.1 hypothetical protein TPA0598_03_06600 [Streptomyces lydicamycinicus]